MSVLNPDLDVRYKTITDWFGFGVKLENFDDSDATSLYFSKLAGPVTIHTLNDVIRFIQTQIREVYAPEPYSVDWYREVVDRLKQIAIKMWEIPASEITFGCTNEYSIRYKEWYCSHIYVSHHQNFASQRRKEISISFYEYLG